MDILEAYDILHKYFSEDDLRTIYRIQNFDSSESDSIRKNEYNAKLLMDKECHTVDKKEKEKLRLAARAFLNLANEENYHL